jgi:hypothetical protein
MTGIAQLPWTPILWAAAAVLALSLYLAVIRPRQLRWGATDAEVARVLPGDDLVTYPSFDATRAVTVKAPPELVWPWIVQIGHRRAGWYSHDWIDNLGRPSAGRIIPELQALEPGDRVPVSPDGRHGFTVLAVDPPTSMLWGDPGELSWLWHLEQIEKDRTRLLTRIRIRYRWNRPAILFHLMVDVGDIVMMRRCLLGIKERAERLAAEGGR